jgi:ABC-type antimicrobial peptide transport system permease subunit
VLIGLVVSVSGARVLSTFLFEVAPSDPASYATAALVLLLAGAGAAWAPALRAGRVDPVVSMRVE